MIYKEHYVEIFVNGKPLELGSQKDINLRLNAVLFNPEKITSNQGEFSFELTIPSTPNNDKIFDFANNLSKLNKFRARFKTEVYADGFRVFTGSLTLNSYENKQYSLNLVKTKVYSLEDIFGEDTLTSIRKLYVNPDNNKLELGDWEIEFDGAETINEYNAMSGTPDVIFPLVSYGVFPKSPVPELSDEVANYYTKKFDMDEYNRWYIESFYPSLNLLETLRNAFHTKGYNVDGDVWNDEFLSQIYMSTNLADGQQPDYNLGNPSFGEVKMQILWSNSPNPLVQDLTYPYHKVGGVYSRYGTWEDVNHDVQYNFDSIQLYDILDEAQDITLGNEKCYMYQPDEHIIVIPADGIYQIYLNINANLLTTADLTAMQFYCNNSSHNVDYGTFDIHPDIRKTTPLEIQLVRNYDSNIELIKGWNNMEYFNGISSDEKFGNVGNTNSYPTAFPHEKLGNGLLFAPTKTDYINQPRDRKHNSAVGYLPNDGEIMGYDPAVSDCFICGFTTMGNETGGGCASVIKNGKSWSNSYSGEMHSFYNQSGYKDVDYLERESFEVVPPLLGPFYVNKVTYYSGETSNYGKNTYLNAPNNFYFENGNNVQGRLYCMVELKKNDVLQLYGIHRNYVTEDGAILKYYTDASISLTIKALTPKNYTTVVNNGYGYYTPTDFPTKLKLTNFLNEETTISSWVQDVINAYNLEVIQEGNQVTINTKKPFYKTLPIAVDIDDRTNTRNAKSARIDYPRNMSVRYKIDTDEWGAENSVVEAYGEEKMNEPDWKNFIDSGYTVIQLNDDTYVTEESTQNLNFAYTWYDDFNWYPVDDTFTKTSEDYVTINIPVISKFSYMVEGYDYEESMKHDGYGLTQRFWYRNPTSFGGYVYTRTYPVERIDLYTPLNALNINNEVLNLSYKATEPSLLQKYFSIHPYLQSNYVYIDAYLTPEEYQRIKGGCLVHFGSDLYWPVEISGYDPSGFNATELKLMKKV